MSRLTFQEEISSRSSDGDEESEEVKSEQGQEQEKENSDKECDAVVERQVADAPSSSTAPAAKLSQWLFSFLQQKRAPSTGEVPNFGPMNDIYLREFHATSQQGSKEDDEVHGSNNDGSVGSIKLSRREKDAGMSLSPYSSAPPSPCATDHAELANDDDEGEEGESIRIFNLPYKMTVEQVIDCAKDSGLTVLDAKLDRDYKNGAPSGSATIRIPTSQANSEIIKSIVGNSWGGRPIRAELCGRNRENRKRRASSDGAGRYFEVENISVKCSICGTVGHRDKECVNTDSIFNPCHLCAGTDHEAVDCPNLTCFRCGQFGHHSRTCRNPRGTKAFACSNCESFAHDIKFCSAFPRIPSKGKNIRCMSCKSWDHVSCKTMPILHDRNVYCPNCGVIGHHCDYPHVNGVTCYDERRDRHRSGSPEQYVYTRERYPNSGRTVSNSSRDRDRDRDSDWNRDNREKGRPSSPLRRSSSRESIDYNAINDREKKRRRQDGFESDEQQLSDEYREKLKQRALRFKK